MRRRRIMKVRRIRWRRRERMNMRRKLKMRSRRRRRTSTMRIWASGHGIESTASPLPMVHNCTSIASNGREK